MTSPLQFRRIGVASLSADEMFAAGHGGSYELDPETGRRTLLTEPAPPAKASEPIKPAAAQAKPPHPSPR
jgi:hypothetical protein